MCDENEYAQPEKRRRLNVDDVTNSSTMNDRNSDGNEESNETEMHHDNDNDLHDQLRQFDVLDEVQGDDSASDASNNGNESSDTDVEDIDIENMLDEGLPEEMKQRKAEQQYEEKFKTVLEEKGHNHFEVLPEGWLQITHNSGMPIYLHKTSRVVTMARPYFLGTGSIRKHQIPISAIPCLNYRKAVQEEGELKELVKRQQNQDTTENDKTNENGSPQCPFAQSKTNIENENENNEIVDAENGNLNEEATNEIDTEAESNEKTKSNQVGLGMFANAKIETVKENLMQQSLTSQQLYDYCKSLFLFKTVRVMRFKSWSARRKFSKSRKQIKNLQRPTLPDGTKLITFPILPADGEGGEKPRAKKEWIMNPNGKSSICILHEYVQHALKKQPTYEFKELENAATPYAATVSINDLKYGTGYGTSKKQAKGEAARETLEILIPEIRDKITTDKNAANAAFKIQKDLSVFDEIRIEDPRVDEFCNKTTEPSPHTILTTCLKRNYGLGDIKVDYQVNASRHKKNEFTMTMGKHKTTVACKNKRDGKQRASQAILQILHPHIKTYGSLLRLYGNHTVKSFKEKKQEEQEITVLQSKAAVNQPNYAILDKLKLEMNKLMECRAAIQPIGTFIAPQEINLPLSSGSNLNNVNL